MSDPLPLPYDSGNVTASILGAVPDVLEEKVCVTCQALLMVVVVGYSTGTRVLSVERAGLCVVCDSLVITGPDDSADELEEIWEAFPPDNDQLWDF